MTFSGRLCVILFFFEMIHLKNQLIIVQLVATAKPSVSLPVKCRYRAVI